jgi:hypothetical protein
MGTSIPRCKTMWSLNRAAGLTSAMAATVNSAEKQHSAAAKRLCMGTPEAWQVYKCRFCLESNQMEIL